MPSIASTAAAAGAAGRDGVVLVVFPLILASRSRVYFSSSRSLKAFSRSWILASCSRATDALSLIYYPLPTVLGAEVNRLQRIGQRTPMQSNTNGQAVFISSEICVFFYVGPNACWFKTHVVRTPKMYTTTGFCCGVLVDVVRGGVCFCERL